MTDVTNSQAGIVITELDEAENAALGGAAMIDQFSNAMAFVERPDFDGQGPHCSPNDPGAWTNHGVTFATWAAWQTLHGAVKSLDLFKSLQLADFYPLYRSMFWNSCQCGNMGAIGIQVFDVAVGSGPGTAGQFVQHVLRAVGSTPPASGYRPPRPGFPSRRTAEVTTSTGLPALPAPFRYGARRPGNPTP